MRVKKEDLAKYLNKPVWLVLINKGVWVIPKEVGSKWVRFDGMKMSCDLRMYGQDWEVFDPLDILHFQWDDGEPRVQYSFVESGESHLRVVDGDLLDAKESILCHQVNCQGVMGAGVAKALYEKWPVVKAKYKALFPSQLHKDLLGKVQLVRVDNGKYVANIFSQHDFGTDENIVYTSYEAIEKALESLYSKAPTATFAFPYGFGCGLAHGDWKIVSGIIEKKLPHDRVTIYRKAVD